MNCCENTDQASENGHLDCLKYLHSQGVQWHPQTTSNSSRNGYLECLKYSHEHGAEWHHQTTFYAAANDHLDCLTYCLENGCPWNYTTIWATARYGKLKCLKYLQDKSDHQWDTSITSVAATNGNLEYLKYAHSQGCELNIYTISSAAFNGKLDCLFYCLENDCPISTQTLNNIYKCKFIKDKNLLTNILLRKILLHPRLKNDITVEKYPEFTKAIENYQQFITKVYQFVESETNLPTDVIKYELIKYI